MSHQTTFDSTLGRNEHRVELQGYHAGKGGAGCLGKQDVSNNLWHTVFAMQNTMGQSVLAAVQAVRFCTVCLLELGSIRCRLSRRASDDCDTAPMLTGVTAGNLHRKGKDRAIGTVMETVHALILYAAGLW